MPEAIEYRSLRDYASRYALHVDCPACRHHARLAPLIAAARVGWDAPLNACVRRSGARGAGTVGPM